eukprot:TRINITY_DN7207_c0_g1_i2.p1 TRINITY_DN7207_c0_g1~~TRINITY_DN7207_c0_g1_i2.p1  ORF type:complete len:484 (+),score=56.81 TRINITY_DN7207_c0_g1_i2:60-1454(+)
MCIRDRPNTARRDGKSFLHTKVIPVVNIVYPIVIFLLLLWYMVTGYNYFVFPGPITILPCVVTGYLIYSKNKIITYILNLRILTYAGLISYSWYLYHWPVIVVAKYYMENVTISIFWGLIILSLVMAIASYMLIERPLKTVNKTGWRALGILLVFLSIFFLTFIHSRVRPTSKTSEVERRRSGQLSGSSVSCPELNKLLEPTSLNDPWRQSRLPNDEAYGCHYYPQDSSPEIDNRCARSLNTPRFMILGDSHGQHLSYGFRWPLYTQPRDMISFTAGGCPSILNHSIPWEHRPRLTPILCSDVNDFFVNIASKKNPTIVILHNQWAIYIDEKRYSIDQLADYLKMKINVVREKIKPKTILIVGVVPIWTPSLPAAFAKVKGDNPKSCPEYIKNGLVDVDKVNSMLSKVAKENGALYFDPHSVLCNGQGCRTYVDDELTTFDYGHLSLPASSIVAAAIRDFTRDI